MVVHTLQFWQTVKSEYNPEKDKYICASSITFKRIWGLCGDDNIFNLADEYLLEIDAKFKRGNSAFLFINVGAEERLDFIDWCIKKFEK